MTHHLANLYTYLTEDVWIIEVADTPADGNLVAGAADGTPLQVALGSYSSRTMNLCFGCMLQG